MPVSRETPEELIRRVCVNAIEEITTELVNAHARPGTFLICAENIAVNMILTLLPSDRAGPAVDLMSRRIAERCLTPDGRTTGDEYPDDVEVRKEEDKAERHNRVAAYTATYLIRELVRGGADAEELLVVLESVAAGVMLGIVKLGGAVPVSEAFASNVADRLSAMQVKRAPSQGSA